MISQAPIVRDVVLVGGGHSHALLIRHWAMHPLPGVRLTLVSRDTLTPYSGMLPGLLAGHYSFEQTHVDLRRLCAWAGIRFFETTMTAINLSARTLSLEDRPDIGFDVLSLDTGSTPDLSVPGAAEYTMPVKPVYNFHARWLDIRQRVDSMLKTDKPLHIGVIGSGAGGFELIMAMRHALPKRRCECHWFLYGNMPVTDRSSRVGEKVLAAAHRDGIDIHADFIVSEVRKEGVQASDGRFVPLDETLWCTGAIGPDWVAAAGFDTDKRGFVATNEYLQSVSHDFVFATGDIGTQQRTPSAKAGVFAVRQAPVLIENLRRYLRGQPLKVYRPQKDFMSLMATGGRSAIGSRGPLVFEGPWVWRWKNHIDVKFMQQLHELPTMPFSALPPVPDKALLATFTAENDKDGATDEHLSTAVMRCRGCGGKVGSNVLDEVLASLQVIESDAVLEGLSAAGDAVVLNTGTDFLVQSVDQLSAIIDDPYRFGRIAVLHALSDVLTMNAEPQSAQVLIILPAASSSITRRELSQLMTGIVSALNSEGCALAGGHTAEGTELTVGLVINARAVALETADGSVLKTVSVARSNAAPTLHAVDIPRPGDRLILTQAIGIGVLFAGLMQTRTQGKYITTAIQHMEQSNRAAADIVRQFDAKCMTDITGFGLIGHTDRMLRAGPLKARLSVADIPLMAGVAELSDGGVRSSLWSRNRELLDSFDVPAAVSESCQALLCDPQTGGGLLAVIPAERAKQCVEVLQTAGYSDAADIGELVETAMHVISP